MNQILSDKLIYKKMNITGYKKIVTKNNKRNLLFYKFVLICSIIVVIISMSYNIYGYKNRNQKAKMSEGLLDIYNISTLYAKSNSYNVSKTSTNEEEGIFSVIGIIRIDSIKISYPILSNINDELLKISPCRFYGSYPNEIGNLCIAAHNYNDNRFFSKIGKLKNGDLIIIYDNIGNYRVYSVYNVYETKVDDISCTSQETNGKYEITLVTCNNLNGNRIIVKARSK